ncbi:MAG: primase alpha helix C-terminal domain-containing protein [Nitrososphaerota archaeon]|nr:primase alpha helix C-terminal domain-containing protein [Nitrososphaerota archaeon]
MSRSLKVALGTDRIESKEHFARVVLERMESLGYARKPRSQVEEILKGVSAGQRNNAGFRYARYLLFKVELDPSAVFNELKRWNLLNNPPLPEKEIETIFRSAINYPPSRSGMRCSSHS